MSSLRLKSHLRASAIVRRAHGAGAFAAIVKRGDDDAGALYVKVRINSDRCGLWIDGRDESGETRWRNPFDEASPETEIDAWLEREAEFDSDLWVIEIEDKEGRSFLD